MYNDYKQKNIALWEEKINNLFTIGGRPETYEWTKLDNIIKVLNSISDNGLGYMFYPDSGGVNCKSVKMAKEEGCIDFHENYDHIILKPKKLIFHSCSSGYEWDYFRIETIQLKPRQSDEDRVLGCSGKYNDRYTDTNDDSNVRRILKGDLVIFATSSSYNAWANAHMGVHNKMSDVEFFNFIKKNV